MTMVMVTVTQKKNRHAAWVPLIRSAVILSLATPLLAWSVTTVDLSDYDPTSAVRVSHPNANTLKAQWSDRGGTQYRVQFSLNSGDPLFRRLETAQAPGDPFTTVAQNVASRYRVTLGTRHAQIGWPYIFFDKVFDNTPAPTAHLSVLTIESVRVVSVSPSRVTIVFSTLSVGPYSGDLVCTLYAGSPFIQLQASMRVDQPWVAYIYDSLLYADFDTVAYRDMNETFQTVPAASLQETTPGESAGVKVKHRTIMGQVSDCRGTVAMVLPPHAGFYPLDRSNNYGFLQAGKTFIGTKMSYWGDRGYVPWIDAPQGATQRMDSFLFFTPRDPEQTLSRVLTYTHGDRYKPVPGHYTMAEHFHPEFTQAYLNGEDTITPFKETMKSLGVQIVHSSEFHLYRNQMHPFKNTEERLAELHAMYTLFERESDDDLVFIPGEEYNHYFGGHWSYLLPKPVYFTGWSGQEGKAYRQTYVESEGVTYPRVYQVGNAETMLQLLRDEGGLAWGAHPRIKDSQQMPDTYMDSDFYRDPVYLAGDWKAMPLDLSQDRLGVRGFQLMDETALWGYKKSMLGEVDTFELDMTHEIYGHMNVNYLKLPSLPSKTDWTSLVECIREGQFFTTTGEVLIHAWHASASGVTAQVEWYFPPAFAEITWGDAKGIHKTKQALADHGEFDTHQITVAADLSAANWVRFEVWDVARNGAFTQPVWLTAPANPAVVAGRVTGFTLIDTDTDAPVPGYDPMPANAVLDLATLPRHLTLRANTSPLILDQVTISLDGVTTSLTQWPYCLTPCAVNQGLRGCPFYDYASSTLTPGTHIIKAAPSQGKVPGVPLTLEFSVEGRLKADG
ncbi:MAG: hypothetical protein K9N55_01235 [Phycisphaerae bacterium]|nr:hypothetical protein [Phycisphaerae bacterium]